MPRPTYRLAIFGLDEKLAERDEVGVGYRGALPLARQTRSKIELPPGMTVELQTCRTYGMLILLHLYEQHINGRLL